MDISQNFLNDSLNFGENFKIISKYFHTKKTCFDKNVDECWVFSDVGCISSCTKGPYCPGCLKLDYAFMLPVWDGIYIHLMKSLL